MAKVNLRASAPWDVADIFGEHLPYPSTRHDAEVKRATGAGARILGHGWVSEKLPIRGRVGGWAPLVLRRRFCIVRLRSLLLVVGPAPLGAELPRAGSDDGVLADEPQQ